MSKKLPYQKFMIGTIEWTRDSDSHATRDKWCVNCVNMWVATLGQKLNPDNAVLEHMVIVLHEITHAMTGIHGHGKYFHSWDETLKRILMELNEDE